MLLEGVQLSLLQQPADRAAWVETRSTPSWNPRPSSTRHSQRAVPIETCAVPLTARLMPRPSSTRHSQRAVPKDIDPSRFSTPSTTFRSTTAARPPASRRFGATM